MFRKLGALLALCASLATAIFFLMPSESAAPISGGATRTWVSGVGDDVNPCSRTAPCKTFAGAISKTASYGEINCIDPGGFGAVTITRSITIDCRQTEAGVLAAGTNAIVINFDSFAVDDARMTVRLRGLDINGANSGLTGIRILGAVANSEVFVEDSVIDGFYGGNPSYGINDARSGGGELNVSNTTIRNIGSGLASAGIKIASASANKINATIDHVHVENADGYGLLTKSGGRAAVTDSVFSGNGKAGLLAENDSVIQAEHVVSSGNLFGLQTSSPGTIRVANSDITLNASAISGTVESFGTNRIAGNTGAGTAPTPVGAVSEARGQQ